MTTTLRDILTNGSLVDNTAHHVRDCKFRRGSFGAETEISHGGRNDNNPYKVWPLVQKAASLNIGPSDVVFRTPDAEYEHNTDDAFVELKGFDPQNFTLTTGNLVGSLKSPQGTLRVSSRFGDEFLKYIIADADGFVELPDHGGTEMGDYQWLLVYLWIVKLKKAFRLGLPKAYESRTESIPQPRGRLDPLDYFVNRDQARYRCTYREHSYDNPATRLIARTLQYLDSHSFLRGSHSLNQTFQTATNGRHHPLTELLAAGPVRNPYFASYNPVISLSKQILRNQFSDFGSQSDTSAFFFDVSMLFEYFVRKLLQRAGAKFQSKTDRRWTIPAGPARRLAERNLVPDLVFEIDHQTYVFDVKYKSFDFDYGVAREDLFQLHTYIGRISHEQEVSGCGFIYPIRESRWRDKGLDQRRGIHTRVINQSGRAIPFHVAFIKVPEKGGTNDKDWPAAFHTAFQNSIKTFLRTFTDSLTARHSPDASATSPSDLTF